MLTSDPVQMSSNISLGSDLHDEHDERERVDSLTRRSFLGITATAGSLALVPRIGASQPGGTDVTSLSIQDAAEQLRRKRISPVELTESCLTRIERLNPMLNAFITVSAESALSSAREAEVEIQRGRWRGSVHGVPIALKDLIDTAGVRTTAASALFKDRAPAEDAEVVRRLKAAGAVIIGKTNMHEFAYGGTSVVSHFGAVHNPWDPGHIAGGSSGGSAAGVAAGLCFGALGSDTAASIRQPAAFCGIVGMKPTYGLVSTRGVFRSRGRSMLGLAQHALSPTPRSCFKQSPADDPADVSSRQMTIPDYGAALRSKVASLRVGVAREFFFADLDPDIEAAMSEALRVLEKLTSGVRDVSVPASGQEELRAAVRASEAYAYHAEFVERSPDAYQPETLLRLRSGMDIKTATYIQGRREVDLVRRTVGKAFETVDVIVTPTTAVQPPTVADVAKDVSASMALGTRTIRNTSPFNVYGWPTISVPCGFTSSGLPIGLQISGPSAEDAAVSGLPTHTRR